MRSKPRLKFTTTNTILRHLLVGPWQLSCPSVLCKHCLPHSAEPRRVPPSVLAVGAAHIADPTGWPWPGPSWDPCRACYLYHQSPTAACCPAPRDRSRSFPIHTPISVRKRAESLTTSPPTFAFRLPCTPLTAPSLHHPCLPKVRPPTRLARMMTSRTGRSRLA